MAEAEADATASFAMDLGITGAEDAKDAAGALALFEAKVTGATDELAGMQKALRLLKGDTVGNAATISALKDKITATKATAAAATAQYLKLGGSFKKTKPDADGIGKSLDLLKKELLGAQSPLSGVGSGLAKIGEAAEAAGPVGLLALAIAAVVTAGIAATAMLANYALASGDARRSEELELEGLTKLRTGYYLLGGGYQLVADKATFLQTALDEVSSKVSIGREQVAGYEKSLYRMGYRAGNLRVALEGLAVSASGGGEAGAQQFMAMAEAGRFAGVSLNKLTDDAKARFGPIVARQMLSVSVQVRKLKENINFLFSGVRLEGFLAGLNKVTELFSANTQSGLALKEILTTIFSPFFDTAGDAGESFANFIKGAELAALKFLIALYPVRRWLNDTFGDESLLGKIITMNGLIDAGTIAFYALGFAAAVAVAPIALIGVALYGTALAVKWLGEKLGDLAFSFVNNDWINAGINIVKGIASGITNGASWVIDAIKSLGKSAIAEFKHVFDMHSPSRLMRKEAINIPKGQAEGIDDGVPIIERAVGRSRDAVIGGATEGPASGTSTGATAAPAASSGTSTGATAAPAASSSSAPLIGQLILQTSDSKSEGQARDFAAQLVYELRKAGVQMGAPAGAF